MSANSNGDKSAEVFRRDFAAALGQALREAEDATTTSSAAKRSQQELAHETYRLLSYDHPVGFTASGCRALSKALTSLERNSRHRRGETQHESYYALSDRLVEGIRQVSYRRAAASQEDKRTKTASMSSTTTNDGDTTRVETDNENLASVSLTEKNIEDSTLSSSAFAALAWNVYGRIPLLCCLSSQLDEASSFLGSYRGSGVAVAAAPAPVGEANALDSPPSPPAPLQNGQHHDNHAQDANFIAQQRQPQSETIMNGNGHAAPADAPPHDHVDDEVSEVWASESDPSDFDFESDWNPEQNVRELDAWANELEHSTDPLMQSIAPPNTQWTHAAQAVTDLVNELNYTKISGLSKDDWKSLKVSDHLTQLVVVLLLVPTTNETTMSTSSSPSASSADATEQATKGNNRNSQYPLLNEKDVYHWQQLALQPLHVFRDAVLSEHDGNTKDDFILKDYLQLLQTLLQVEYSKRGGCSNHVSRTIESSLSQLTTTVVPATWVGLSALSTMCSNCLNDMISSNINRRRIGVLRTAVLEASDDLCHILEQSAAGNSDAMRDAIPWTYLSLFQIFSTTTTTTTSNNNSITTNPLPTLSNAQIQILLNSGLFRQWLLLWSKLRGEGETSAVHGAVLQSIFDLCCISPTLLGKYAWRFPGLAAFATATEFVLENAAPSADNGGASIEIRPLLDPHRHQRLRSCFSWNLLGIRLAEETSGGSASSATVKWKSNSKTASSSSTASATPPTATEAQNRTWALFQQLCANLSPVLLAWKERRCISTAAKQKPLEEQRAEESALLRLVEDDVRRLSEFNAVVDSLSNPTLQPLFSEKMTPAAEKGEGGGGSMILDLTLPIQQALAAWPSPLASYTIESGTKVKTDDASSNAGEIDHEATSPRQAMRRRVQLEESSINAVRKSIKVLKSIVESSIRHSSGGFSSKAD